MAVRERRSAQDLSRDAQELLLELCLAENRQVSQVARALGFSIPRAVAAMAELVQHDLVQRREGRVNLVLHENELPELCPEPLRALAHATRRALNECRSLLNERPVPQWLAQQVRVWRVRDHASWREVARFARAEWDAASWIPEDSELMGRALCERSAAVLCEDPYATPWN